MSASTIEGADRYDGYEVITIPTASIEAAAWRFVESDWLVCVDGTKKTAWESNRKTGETRPYSYVKAIGEIFAPAMKNGFWFHGGWVGDQPQYEAPAGFRWECYVSKTEREVWMNGGRRRWYLVQEWQPPKDACAQSLKALVNTSPGIVDE